jgi:hypothetical protein
MNERLFRSYYVCRAIKPFVAGPRQPVTAWDDNVNVDPAHRIAAE